MLKQPISVLRKENPYGITHVLNVSDMYVLPPGVGDNLVSEWVPRWGSMAGRTWHDGMGSAIGKEGG